VDPFFVSRYTPTIPFAVSKAVTMMNLLLDNTSAQFPLNAALTFQNRSYTYADLSRLTQCLATSLLQRGISPGDRVAFLLPNGIAEGSGPFPRESGTGHANSN
jgi:non-ribosomal peptide synthetase component F